MRLTLIVPAVAAGLLSLTACDIGDWGGDFERFSRDFHYSYPLSANGRLTLETMNGSVEISGWDQNTIDISGTKYGPTQSAADEIKINIDHNPDSVSIHVDRPYDHRNRGGAKFVVKIPRAALVDRITSSNGAIRITDGNGPSRLKSSNANIDVQNFRGELDIQTSNGGVDLIDVEGDVVARTSNARIRTERFTGSLDATTSNGAVTAEVARADRPIKVGTSNGSVELRLPDGFSREVRVTTSNSSVTVHLPGSQNARVVAHTSNSSISTDFETTVRGEIDKNHMDASIGSGGPLLDIRTSNGSVRLARM